MRIGIDLGGTKTEIICLHAVNGKELFRKRVPSPQGSYEATLDNLERLVGEAEQELGQTGTVGIGIPGCVSSESGTVKNSNSIWINGMPLQKDLSARLGREIKIENDANCLALSEATDGAGEGYPVVFAVIIGTGCGSGIVVHGHPVSGLNGLGGEWGHNPLPFPRSYQSDALATSEFFDDGKSEEEIISHIYLHKDPIVYSVNDLRLVEAPGPLCYCGKRGCLEKWISGTGFKEDFARVNGEEISTHDIVAFAKEGEIKAREALERYSDRLARALAGVINILDPDIIVLGGGMSNVSSLYKDVPLLWDKYIFSDTVRTKLLPARHGDSSGVRGAAWLWGRDA
ncbi:MAG: ROK family protein [Pseudobdellovibrionaceae bacterium]|nr:ROK family protein [Pseudobdellovibrionaceae bacterium]